MATSNPLNPSRLIRREWASSTVRTEIPLFPSDSLDSPPTPSYRTYTYISYGSISNEQKINQGWNLALEKPKHQVRCVTGL